MFVALLASFGCGAPADGPSDTIDDGFETGFDCLTAEGYCRAGGCRLHLENSCAEAHTCELAMETLCSTSDGGQGVSEASSGDTIPSREARSIEVRVMCDIADALIGYELSCS